MPANGRRCDTCEFYEANPDAMRFDTWEDTTGFCLRYPAPHDSVAANPPAVLPERWCGEYRKSSK